MTLGWYDLAALLFVPVTIFCLVRWMMLESDDQR